MSIVTLITRMLIQRGMNWGTRKGIDAVMKRGSQTGSRSSQSGHTDGPRPAGNSDERLSPEERRQARQARENAKRARQAARIARRMIR